MHLLTPPWTIVNQPGSLNQHRVFHLLIGDMWVNKTEHVQVQVQAEQQGGFFVRVTIMCVNFPVHTILEEAWLKYFSEKV